MKTKTFDCIKMKEECQRAVELKYGSLPLEERRQRIRADILANPILGPLYKQLEPPAMKVAETQTPYNTAATPNKNLKQAKTAHPRGGR